MIYLQLNRAEGLYLSSWNCVEFFFDILFNLYKLHIINCLTGTVIDKLIKICVYITVHDFVLIMSNVAKELVDI